MDLVLRCNSLKCRAQLTDRAIVTTCSHIFCDTCANGLRSSDVRICPACQNHLTNSDDAVLTALNPPEDYKTSVLSGLSPSIIMECASRGLNFYQYQLTQEVTYQEYMAQKLTDRYSTLSAQMDSIITDANAEITSLRDKLSASVHERKTLESKNSELAEAFKEKSRAQQRLQGMYQKLKGRVSAVAVEDAANHDVEHVIHTVTGGRRNGSDGGRGGGGGGATQRPGVAHLRGSGSPGMFSHGRQGSVGRAGMYGTENQENFDRMPQPHPGRLSAHTYPSRGDGPNQQASGFWNGSGVQTPAPARQPLGNIDLNVVNGPPYAAYSGHKISRQGGGMGTRSSSVAPRNFGHSILGMR